MYIIDILLFLSVLFIPLVMLFYVYNDKKTSDIIRPFLIIAIYIVSVIFIVVSLMVLSDTEFFSISDNVILIYMFISGVLIFIPFLIRCYFLTKHYPEKDRNFYLTFLVSSIISLAGLFMYLNNIRMLNELLPFLCLISVFIPFIPILICMYYRKKR